MTREELDARLRPFVPEGPRGELLEELFPSSPPPPPPDGESATTQSQAEPAAAGSFLEKRYRYP